MKNDNFKKYWKTLSIKGKIWHVTKVILSLIAVLVMVAGFLYIMFLVFMMGAAVLQLRDVILQDFINWLG